MSQTRKEKDDNQIQEKGSKRRKVKINTFYRAVKHYNKFVRVESVNDQTVLYENKKGQLFVALGTPQLIKKYIETGNWLIKITFRCDLFSLNFEQNLNLQRRCIKIFGKKDAIPIYKEILRKARGWKVFVR